MVGFSIVLTLVAQQKHGRKAWWRSAADFRTVRKDKGR
jgi:hypothetical protein